MNNYGRSKNIYSAGLVTGNISYQDNTPTPRKLRDSQFTLSSGGSGDSNFSFSGKKKHESFFVKIEISLLKTNM